MKYLIVLALVLVASTAWAARRDMSIEYEVLGWMHDGAGNDISVICDRTHGNLVYHAKNGYGEAMAVVPGMCR